MSETFRRIATCPWCLLTTNAITGFDDDGGPDHGSVSVCEQCVMPSVVDDDAIGGLRKPTRREHELLAADRRVVTVMAALLKAQGRLE